MMMSWLAEKNATSAPRPSVTITVFPGSLAASANIASASASCTVISQPRLRPKNNGRISSNTGAQTNLSR